MNNVHAAKRNFEVGTTTIKSFGVQLNIPLFQGGATQSKCHEADANRELARQELENTRHNVAFTTVYRLSPSS